MEMVVRNGIEVYGFRHNIDTHLFYTDAYQIWYKVYNIQMTFPKLSFKAEFTLIYEGRLSI
jgi:hypothetical protein